MNKEINKIISWIEMSYTRLNYKEELLLVNYIKQLQQENSRLKEELEELKHKHYLIQGGRGNGKTYLLHLQQENKQLKDKLIEIKEVIDGYMPNKYAMCKAFDEIEFIIKEALKEVE